MESKQMENQCTDQEYKLIRSHKVKYKNNKRCANMLQDNQKEKPNTHAT